MDSRVVLAGAMRRLRRECDMTLRDVEKITGIPPYKLHRSENGQRPPLSARAIASIYGVPPSEVWKLCPHCGYEPPAGYMCLTCGTKNQGGLTMRKPQCAFCRRKMRKVTISGVTWWECPVHPRILPKRRGGADI